MEKKSFECGGRKAALYCGEKADAPLIVLNHYSEDDGDSVLRAMREIDTPDCSLLVVGNIRWNHDMAPWDCMPVIRNDAPYTGGADEHLNLLRTRMIPEALALTGGRPSFLGIAGYSLAGLFALYAAWRCDAFDRAACMSGSFWFPGFREYVLTHDPIRRPEKLYFSLGDREAKTRHPILKTVQSNTEEIREHCEALGIPVTWELNPGNHFSEDALRTAKGIRGILE